MIIDKEKMDTEKFKSVFAKKFKNFCSKLPILVSYKLLPNGVTIYEHEDEDETNKRKLLFFEYDYDKSVQKNIYTIKKMLYKYFPMMVEDFTEEVEASSEQTNQKISEGVITLQDVTPYGYLNRYSRYWQIERVIVDRDELFIRDLDSKELKRYKMSYPVFTFLKKIRNKQLDDRSAWNFFISKSEPKPLDPRDEGESKND